MRRGLRDEAPSIQGSGIVLGSGASGPENSSRTIAGLVSS